MKKSIFQRIRPPLPADPDESFRRWIPDAKGKLALYLSRTKIAVHADVAIQELFERPYGCSPGQVAWGIWEMVREGQLIAAVPFDDGSNSLGWGEFTVELPKNEVAGEQSRKPAKRRTTSTIERDLGWLKDFEDGNHTNAAFFAQEKRVEPPAMRAALKRARDHRKKKPRKSSGKK